MLVTQTILSFFEKQSVQAACIFLGEYAAENTLDILLKKKDKDLDSSELISKQLYEALDESLKTTCKHLKTMEYDANAIKETFSVHDNPWNSINSEEKLISIVKRAIGKNSFDILSPDDILYWFNAFNQAVATRQELYNFIHAQETRETRKNIHPYAQVYESPEKLKYPQPFSNDKKLIIGDIVANRYRVIKQIGTGGYGKVLLVHDHHLRRDAAMKIFYNSHGHARNELEILNGLKHPGLPYIYDILQISNDKTAIIMDLIKGHTLMQEAFSSHGLSVQQAIDITRQLCEVVSFLHNLNIIHGDIKPNNIMLDYGRVVLIDYNLSQFVNETSFPMGRTDGYSPPEFYLNGEWEEIQFIPSTSIAMPMLLDSETYWVMRSSDEKNSIVSIRSDIYSIGATVFYMLTGQHPWPYEHAINVIEGFDPTLQIILNGCLQKNPLDRFSSVQDILVILEESS